MTKNDRLSLIVLFGVLFLVLRRKHLSEITSVGIRVDDPDYPEIDGTVIQWPPIP